MRGVLVSALVGVGLVLAGETSVALLPVRVSIEVAGGQGTVTLEGTQHAVSVPDRTTSGRIRFEQPGPLQREFQIDGSDTTTRHDLDAAQFGAAQNLVWYRVLAWLRDEGSYSRWEDIRLIDLADGHVVAHGRSAVETTRLPAAFRLEAALRRPEAQAGVWIESADAASSARGGLSIERQHHQARWVAGVDAVTQAAWFFPNDPWPFLAEIIHLVGRCAMAALALFATMGALGVATQAGWRWIRFAFRRPHRLALPPFGVRVLLVLAVWLTAALWVTVRLYHQLPHIVDAEAYALQARILETGHTWLQPPPVVRFLDGFQQVVWHDRWFTQYPPGAPAAYAAGGLFGVAWLVGPLASVVMLGATTLAGWRMFGRSVALTGLGLGALSPFVLFQAGSFMSHPIAAAALACSLAVFLYAWSTCRSRWYVLAGVLLGVAFLTREVAGLLYGLVFASWLLAHRRWRAVAWLVAGGLPFLGLYLAYNYSITGDFLTLPRSLFNPDDRWGFGDVGSSGRHTLAAGLVNTDQNLTLLQFDLFGWPPLAALALVGLPFVLGRATRFDVMLALCAGSFVVAYVGYFYEGIALGPRYYFEAVPALVLLAARGVQVAVQTLRQLGLSGRAPELGAAAVVLLLSAYSLAYYLPHAIDRRMDYGALDNNRRLVLPFVETTFFGPRLKQVEAPALVLVANDDIFKAISAMNCPLLDRDHIGQCSILLLRAGLDEVPGLLQQFPGRAVWYVEAHGDLVSLDQVASAP